MLDQPVSEISARAYAAIHLREPCSGDAELDAVIRRARRRELAGAAMVMLRIGDANNARGMAERAVELADALLAAMGDEQPPRYVKCDHCGRAVDTFEPEDGGDEHGCQLSDGKWVCSPECEAEATGVYPDDAALGEGES